MIKSAKPRYLHIGVAIVLIITTFIRCTDSQVANTSTATATSINTTIILTNSSTSHHQTENSTYFTTDPSQPYNSVNMSSALPSILAQTISSNATIKNTTKDVKFDSKICRYYPIPRGEYNKERCCQIQYKVYTERWIIGSYYLVTILERMKRWRCKQFEYECRNPTWPFTEYSRKMHDLFCHRNHLEQTCYKTVYDISDRYGFLQNPSSNMSWKSLIETLNSRRMDFTDLTKSCVQVALFDRKDGGVGRFHEVIEPFVPFCGLQWEGYDYYTALYRSVSPWTGMSIWCRSSVIICVVVMAVAGIVTIVSNILVLVVFGTTARLRNSQAVYKISLGAADLMVGVVVWPNMIVLQYLTFWEPRTMGSKVNRPYWKTDDKTPYYSNPNLTYRYGGGVFRDIFPTEYVRVMGFFTMLGLMVSIYSLMIASFDRFWAVFRPLRYNRFNAKRQAIILSAVVWSISMLVCLLPTFTPGFLYKVMSSILINLEGIGALAFILIALLLPLIITWVVTVLTFHMSRQHARARQKIVSTTTSSSDALERRLAKTLSIMVGAFTLSVVPTICCTIAGLASTVTNWETPWYLNLKAATAYTTSEYLSIIILTSNSLWNFLIYSLRTRGFREVASDKMQTFCEKTGIEFLRRGAMRVVSGARRVSLSTMMNMRRFSTPDTTDSRKKSVTSMTTTSKMSESNTSSSGRPSVDYRDSSIVASTSTDTAVSSKYAKSANKYAKPTSGVEMRAERKKAIKKEAEEYAGEDSTFGSFAINAGTDRLFESVMENVPEEIEHTSDTVKI